MYDTDASSKSVSGLVDSMTALWDAVFQHGAQVVVVFTLPTNPTDIESDDYRKLKSIINDEIRARVKNLSLREKTLVRKLVLIDLPKEIDIFAMDESKREEMYSDDLHYSPVGYNKMAELIFDTLQPLFNVD